MIHRVSIVLVMIAILLAGSAAMLRGQGNSHIYLVTLSSRGDVLTCGAPKKITTSVGYNNQPFFHPDGSGLFYSSANRGQCDIYFYALKSEKTSRLTNTLNSEYSPTVMPSGNEISVIQQNNSAGLRGGAQPLMAFPINGGEPRLLYEEGKKIGYHAWIDGELVAVFVLGEPHTLQLVNIKSKEAKVLAGNIGRSLYKAAPGRSVCFIQYENGGALPALPGMIRVIDCDSGAAQDVARLPALADLFCLASDQSLFTAVGTVIFRYVPGADKTWRPVGDFASLGVKSITRVALSPQMDCLAFVAE